MLLGRSPHGERGLKYGGGAAGGHGLLSLPSRGAWIEIRFRSCMSETHVGRSPHGERGLKSGDTHKIRTSKGRSPHGERGLKWVPPAAGPGGHSRSPHGERGLK